MKKQKDLIIGYAKYSNGKTKMSRIFTDPEAFSRWANKQYLKDEEVVITEYRNWEVYSTWSA